MKSHFKFSLLLTTVLLTGCGYRLKELYSASDYNSIYYGYNYYRHKVDDFKGANTTKISLTNEGNYVFTSLKDSNYTRFVENKESISGHILDNSISMIKIDDSFKYGMTSKLFDGWWECGGRFEEARIQMDEDGFDVLFDKQCRQNPQYVVLSFQNALGDIRGERFTNYNSKERFPTVNAVCDITLSINFYLLENNQYKCISCSYDINDRKANSSDYVFFGFELDDSIDITNCKGVSFDYTLNSIRVDGIDVTSEYNHKEKDLESLPDDYGTQVYGHSLWLYELYLADSTWH